MNEPIPVNLFGIQHRAAEIEAFDVDSGEIVLRAAPYDVETQLGSELFESFAPRTFERARNAPSRCKLWHLHGGPLIGHALEVDDRPDGAWVRAKFSNTVPAQEARELASDGTLDACSVTFQAMPEFMRSSRLSDGVHVRHSRAGLLGVALVPHGAYEDARVVSVRELDPNIEREARIAALRALTH